MNQRGMITIEAVYLIPTMLIGLCILISITCVFFKGGAGQLIFNSGVMASELQIQAPYQLLQLDDFRTTSQNSQKTRGVEGNLTWTDSEATLVVKAPFSNNPKSFVFKDTCIRTPLLYEISLIEYLGQKQETREHGQ